MLLEVLLLSIYAGLLYLKSVSVLQFDLCLLQHDLLYNFFEVRINLLHDFDLAFLNIFVEVKSLVDQNFSPVGQILQVGHNFIPILL